jgi:integrase
MSVVSLPVSAIRRDRTMRAGLRRTRGDAFRHLRAGLRVDRNMTKTREDRGIRLCPRALATLKGQLSLCRQLKARGSITHDHLFFGADGAPIRRLGYLSKCWRQSSERLGLRHRRPYVARHTSVSWNLMIGKNPLFVARQHRHSVTTMFRTYAAWMQNAPNPIFS